MEYHTSKVSELGCDLTTHQLITQQSRIQYFNEKPKGRRLVIPDIHGCAKTFRLLIDKIGLTHDDHLFLLGDYINRGEDSAGVLDFIFELQDADFQVFPLMGNHEFALLDTLARYERKQFVYFISKMSKAGDLLAEDGTVKPKYLAFFQKLHYRFELPDFHLVHAGFDCQSEQPLERYSAMLEVRNVPQILEKLNGKRVVHGHQPTYLDTIYEAIHHNLSAIPLDNGAVYALRQKHPILDTQKLGNLIALNLDNFEITIQKNSVKHKFLP